MPFFSIGLYGNTKYLPIHPYFQFNGIWILPVTSMYCTCDCRGKQNYIKNEALSVQIPLPLYFYACVWPVNALFNLNYPWCIKMKINILLHY